MPKPVNSQKRWCNSQTEQTCYQSEKDVKYSNIAKICQQSKLDGSILKQNKPVTSQEKMVQYSNRAKTFHQSEKDGTILKQSQNPSPVRKRWYNTETVQKPVTSQKRWHNTQTEYQQSEKDRTILKQSQNM